MAKKKVSNKVTKKGLERDAKNFARAFKQLEAGEPITGPITVGGFPVTFVDDDGTEYRFGEGQ